MIETVFEHAADYIGAHAAPEAMPVEAMQKSIAFFENLWVSDPIPPPQESKLADAFGTETRDAFTGDANETYLTDLADVQIPAMREDIATAMRELDPVRDQAIIEELQNLDAKLSEIQTHARYGYISPEEAYERLTDALTEMRENVFKEVQSGPTAHTDTQNFSFAEGTPPQEKSSVGSVGSALKRFFDKY